MGKRSYQSYQELSCSYNKRHKQIYSTDNTNANKDIKKYNTGENRREKTKDRRKETKSDNRRSYKTKMLAT